LLAYHPARGFSKLSNTGTYGLRRPSVVMKSLGEERLQIKTYLALRADESSWMVNEFARAFFRKCSPTFKSGAHLVGAKT
jgi:hypothetical protein